MIDKFHLKKLYGYFHERSTNDNWKITLFFFSIKKENAKIDIKKNTIISKKLELMRKAQKNRLKKFSRRITKNV